MPNPQATSFATPITSAWSAALSNANGLVILGFGSTALNATIPTTAGLFSPGCIMVNAGGSSASTNLYANSGTAASPVWTVLTIS